MSSIREKVARRRCLMECINGCTSADECGAWKAWKDDTRKHLTIIRDVAAEEGWHMRPDKVTRAMEEAPAAAWGFYPVKTWRDMCEAAPKFEWDK